MSRNSWKFMEIREIQKKIQTNKIQKKMKSFILAKYSNERS